MLQLENKTPFAASFSIFANEYGVDCLYVMIKGTFKVGKQWTLADTQPPPQEADEYLDEPLTSSLIAASDFHIGKSGTDIVMQGDATAKDGKPVRALDVLIGVGNREKTVRIFGDRVWQGGQVSNPETFERMPLIYERAFGGVHLDEHNQMISSETRNPVGCGYIGKRNSSQVEGLLLPNLEDPQELIQSPKDTPTPACFSFVSPNWLPRTNYAGTYDDAWQTERAPYLPKDFSRRFLNTAHEALIYDGFVQGGEPVRITNMHPAGDMQFRLPTINLKCRINVAGSQCDVQPVIETLVFKPNDLQLTIGWKVEFPCDKKIPRIKNIVLNLAK